MLDYQLDFWCTLLYINKEQRWGCASNWWQAEPGKDVAEKNHPTVDPKSRKQRAHYVYQFVYRQQVDLSAPPTTTKRTYKRVETSSHIGWQVFTESSWGV